MMTEIDLVSWLPAQSRRMLAEEQREDDSQEREAKRARVARHEQLADRAIATAVSEAAARGEYVSPVDAVNGRIGRTLEEILLGAAGEVADRVPKPLREPNPEWLGAGEPVILPARSANGLRLFNRYRHWQDRQEAKRRLAEAERTAEYFAPSHPVTLRSQPTATLTARSGPAPDGGLRFRSGGPVVGIR
jgi:hypothetical protein